MFSLQYYYFMPLGFALICFAFCVRFYRFLGEFYLRLSFYAVPTRFHL